MAWKWIRQAISHVLGGGSSNAAPPDGIETISDSVYKLFEPEGPVKVEIVFIHGLRLFNHKDAYWKTWMGGEKGQEICWPKTWLGEDLPGAQIWSLSYDSCASRTNTSGRMDAFILGESLVQEMVDIARIGQGICPVVFVCHCLGGLVVKEIVIKAHRKFGTDPKYMNFLQNVRGFFFYATPHVGSKLADLAFHVPGKSEMIEFLGVIDKELGRLNADFQHIGTYYFSNKWQFSVVAETHETTWFGFSGMVVEEASARHVYDKVLSVSADHFGVCKPLNKSSSSYMAMRNFVDEVLKDNRPKDEYPLTLPTFVVGIEDRVQEVCKKLEMHSIVGLVGMGGIGKTTLSKYLFLEKKKYFEKVCFLEDVKSRCIQASQKQLFGDLCGGQWDESKSVDFHLEKIKECILIEKVLLVVDDPPSEEENLKALMVDAFRDGRKGSKVIVTTRRRDILLGDILLDNPEGIMNLEVLEEHEALELFSWYAFCGLVDGVKVRFAGMAADISKACGGLPLSLEVMGQFLRKFNHSSHAHAQGSIWAKALEKLRNAKSLDGSSNAGRLWTTLKLSYDDLDSDHQRMFLDFACIMCEVPYRVGCVDELYLGRIWGDPIGVQNLINKSLIKWSDDKKTLVMHDQLRDMGRRIMMENSANGNILWMWQKDEGLKIMLQNSSWKILEGLLLCDGKVSDEDWLRIQEKNMGEVKCFEKLRLLNLEGSELRVVEYYVQSCLEALTWLCLNYTKITGRCIEKLGSFLNLRVLEMRDCKELQGLPTDLGNLSVLMEMDLSGCTSLKCLPESIGDMSELQILKLCWCEALEGLPASIGRLSCLIKLDLSLCGSLKSVPESIVDLERLQLLWLFGCGRLEELPVSIGRLSCLVKLDLSSCSSLKSLPESIGDLERLQLLRLDGCINLEVFLASIGRLSCLIELDLSGCRSLKSLAESIGDLERLQILGLDGCRGLKELPASIGRLSCLLQLNLSYCCSLKSLPESIGDLERLQILVLDGCVGLEELPASTGRLSCLIELKLSGCSSLKSLPGSIGDLERLDLLWVNGCEGLEELPASICRLACLMKLDLIRCRSLKSLPESIGDFERLPVLMLYGCEGLEELPASIGRLSCLIELHISWCCSLKSLPESIGDLESLQELWLKVCAGLEELPTSIGRLSCLIKLDLSHCCSLKSLPESIGDLVRLELLSLDGCEGLEELPASIGGLSCLIKLHISWCCSLKSLPESIGDLESLQELSLDGCEGLEELPASIGHLSCLIKLDLSRCRSLKSLPESIGDSERLQILGLDGCGDLEELPASIGRLSCLIELDLSRCWSLKSVPESIGDLERLELLSLDGCGDLAELPASIDRLSCLIELDLSRCWSLKSLPESIGDLERLELLSLDGCEGLDELPASIGRLSCLIKLHISWCCSLKSLPESIGDLESLQELSLDGCEGLEELPASIGRLSCLMELDLSE